MYMSSKVLERTGLKTSDVDLFEVGSPCQLTSEVDQPPTFRSMKRSHLCEL
jgi:hypothetical protein